MATNGIIDSAIPKVVFREQEYSMSDVKFKSILSHTYERGQKESKAPSYREWSSAFFSAFTTLLLTHFTASFQSLFGLDAAVVSYIAWFMCGVFLLLGIIFRVVSVLISKSCSINDRDKAVQEILNDNIQLQYIGKENV